MITELRNVRPMQFTEVGLSQKVNKKHTKC